MIRLVIFDLDGTLLDTVQDLAVSANVILERNNYSVHPLESYKVFVGDGVYKLIERALPETARDEETIMKIKDEFVAYYNAHLLDYTVPYQGILDLLTELQRREIKLAVVSNKPHAQTEALIKECLKEFSFVYATGNKPHMPHKPDPAAVYEAIKAAGVQKEEVLYVGDSGVDMLTAKNAGLKGIGVTWGFRTREELAECGAFKIIDEPKTILELL